MKSKEEYVINRWYDKLTLPSDVSNRVQLIWPRALRKLVLIGLSKLDVFQPNSVQILHPSIPNFWCATRRQKDSYFRRAGIIESLSRWMKKSVWGTSAKARKFVDHCLRFIIDADSNDLASSENDSLCVLAKNSRLLPKCGRVGKGPGNNHRIAFIEWE